MAHRPTVALGRRKSPPARNFPYEPISLTLSFVWSPSNFRLEFHSRNLDRNAYALKLDTSVDVSVVLQDMKPGAGPGPVKTLDLKEIFSKTPSSAPGKFYNPEAGSVVLGTLKTGGPCARVELMPGEDEEHEQNWEKFRDRLEKKDVVSRHYFFYLGGGFLPHRNSLLLERGYISSFFSPLATLRHARSWVYRTF